MTLWLFLMGLGSSALARSLDGTSQSLTSPHFVNQDEALEIEGGKFRKSITGFDSLGRRSLALNQASGTAQPVSGFNFGLNVLGAEGAKFFLSDHFQADQALVPEIRPGYAFQPTPNGPTIDPETGANVEQFTLQKNLSQFPYGGWYRWAIKGVLEDEGDLAAGAYQDAVSLVDGLTWITPGYGGSYEHDADGNRESAPGWQYGWDGRNRLVEAITEGYATTPSGTKLQFEYDAEGRRVQKIVTQKAGGIETVTRTHFVWHEWDLLYECQQAADNSILLERKYVWGADLSGSIGGAGGSGGLLAIHVKKSGNTAIHYPLYDGTGNVVGLADAGNALVAEYRYGPFGELISATGPAAQENPWRFGTKYYDVETRLSYFGHRYFDSVTGNWLSREPLGEGESLNLYAYCHGDPINKVDVLGLASIAVGAEGRFLPSTQLTNERAHTLTAYALEDIQTALAVRSAADQVFTWRVSHVEKLFREHLDSTTRYYGENIHGWDRSIFNAAEGARLSGADPELLVLVAHQAQRGLDESLAEAIAKSKRKREWDNSGLGRIFNTADKMGRIIATMPGVLEYFGREVVGFNSLTRTLGGEWAPGFDSFSEVSPEMRLLAAVELGLLAKTLYPKGYVAPIRGAGDDLVIVYRGTDIGSELAIFDEAGAILSDAGRSAYLSARGAGGSVDDALAAAYRSSGGAHSQQLSAWGSLDDYVQAHGAFGQEISVFGPRSMISFTTDPDVARRFGSTIFEFQVPRSSLIPQTLPGAGEAEVLLLHGLRK